MLPRYVISPSDLGGNFDYIFMENTPLNPDRIYVWLLKEVPENHITAGLYTTSDPRNLWTQVVNDATILPQPYANLTNAVFAVSPNSPGNGNQDILFFGGLVMQRSIDGGANWSPGNANFHEDMHAIAFFSHNTNPADVYIGGDGGIAYCHHFADPLFLVDPISERPPSDPSRTRFNQGDRIDEHDGQFRNLNHGRPRSIIFSYSSHPEISTLEYIACQDTGISASWGTSSWRYLASKDSYNIAVAPGLDGVKIWGTTGAYDTRRYGWPNIKLTVMTDKGNLAPPSELFPSLPGGSDLSLTSNIEIIDKESWSGCYALESTSDSRKLNRPIGIMNPLIEQNAYPSSMSGINIGSSLILDERTDNIEEVRVTGLGRDPDGAQWFRATFAKPHDRDAPIRLMKSVVVSVDVGTNGPPRVIQKGQDFGVSSNPNPEIRRVNRIGISQNPNYRNKVCCATIDKKLWIYDGESDNWNEVLAPNSLPSFEIIFYYCKQ